MARSESVAGLPQFSPEDALIVVDVQRDFCPGGKLAVEDGDAVVPLLNAWISAARKGNARVVASRDWHPPGHTSFEEKGGPWPEHCLQESEGAELPPDLKRPEDAELLSKGDSPGRDQYSAFDGTGLAERLRARGVRRVWIGGLAEDVCVRATALDAAASGFKTHVVAAATRPTSPEAGEQTRREMQRSGVELFESASGEAS